eukprot:3408728-Alexandrium_andersonii.AAC.1
MSASLVGSEMCIRDSIAVPTCQVVLHCMLPVRTRTTMNTCLRQCGGNSDVSLVGLAVRFGVGSYLRVAFRGRL